jgi:hypothetical protein
MEIDRKRIAAVRTLEVLGHSYSNGEWLAPAAVAGTPLPVTTDTACMEGSHEAGELKAIVDLIEACEAMWGPLDRDPDVPEGKG